MDQNKINKIGKLKFMRVDKSVELMKDNKRK